MEFISFMLNVAWRTLCLCGGIMLFIYVMRHGFGVFKDVLDTIAMAMKTAGHWVRKKCLVYMKKESAETKVDEKDIPDWLTIEDYEEFVKVMEEHRNATLNHN